MGYLLEGFWWALARGNEEKKIGNIGVCLFLLFLLLPIDFSI